MRFIYPALPYQLRAVYPLWKPEYEWAQASGLATGLVDVDNEKCWLPALATNAEPILYRSWMLSAAGYATLVRLLFLARSPAGYLASHEASGWTESVAEYIFPGSLPTAPVALDFDGGRRYFKRLGQVLWRSLRTDQPVAARRLLAAEIVNRGLTLRQ